MPIRLTKENLKTIKPYAATEWVLPNKMTASVWADTFRRLDVKTSAEPGQWSTNRTPYLKGIMDAFTDPQVDEITVMSASQVGKTEAILNMLGYIIDQDPGPTLMVLPRADDAKSVSSNRIKPMIESSPALSRYIPQDSDEITKLEYHFERMFLYFSGSNSPADLASRPIRYLFLDEVDKYPKFSGREADPIKLAQERQKTFWNKKTVKVSTPTTREGYIFREYEKSDQRQFFVPCPHCGKMQVLVFGQVKWPTGESSSEKIKNDRLAWYECLFCKQHIEDSQKPKMMLSGEWVPDKKEQNKNRGFCLSSLYSPWLTWSDIAAEFLKSKDYVELLMNFVNSWLAEVWEEKIEETTVDKVRNLAREYEEGFVPDEVLVLTAGVDVQKDHFNFVIRGWGYYEESWLIRASEVEYWQDIEEALFKTEYKRLTSAETLPVYLSCIDSGFKTDEVYRFCRHWQDKTKAIKGVEELTGGRFYRANKIDINSRTGAVIPGGLVLWHLNVTQYKDKINRLIHSRDPVKWHIFKNPSEDYLYQFASEHKILIRNRTTGKAKEVWQKKKEAAANHFLDAEVYALAAADIIRALNMRKDGTIKVYQPKAEPYLHSREGWIRKRQGPWL